MALTRRDGRGSRSNGGELTMPSRRDGTCSAHDSKKEESFERGRAAGQLAAAELQATTPLDASQIAWLSGFLQGLAATAVLSVTEAVPPLVALVASEESLLTTGAPKASNDSPYTARISHVETYVAENQQIWIDVALDIDEGRLNYRPGSTLALWPTNDPEEVRRILRTLGVSAQLKVATAKGAKPAWQVLLEQVDICRTSRRTLELLAEYSRSDSEAIGLSDLAEANLDPNRPLLALLKRYPSARPPLDKLLTCLAPLEPTFVPIASSNLENTQTLRFTARSEAVPAEWGDISTAFGAKVRAGEWLTVSVSEERYAAKLSEDELEPVIIVADGVGIAFARAFVAERLARGAKGRTWVIGAGLTSPTFPYSSELSAWHKSGSLRRLDLARGFDLGGIAKTLEQIEEMFWRWIVDHSRVFVISTRPEFRETLEVWMLAVLVRRQKLSVETAEQRLSELKNQGVWNRLPDMVTGS
jgi:sulfite reductase (NADPH) flavoprotein alpha-component